MKTPSKSQILNKGKKIFGDVSKFNNWLNSDVESMGCKPISIWETKKGLKTIYDELVKLEKTIKV